jgi:protein SHQ1
MYDGMVRLGNREHLLSKESNYRCQIMLVEILYAYLYDWRTMDFEVSCESAWTICKLCPFLTGFVYHDTVKDSMLNQYRRVMIYPIYRHFKLARKIQSDLVDLLAAGRLPLLVILLAIRHLFERSAPRYMLNILYIDDLIVFAQNADENTWLMLSDAVKQAVIEKHDLALMLDEFENEGMELDPD